MTRGIKTTGITRVDDARYGVYIWKLPNGKPLMDDDMNMLSISSERGDIRKMAELCKVAKSYGFPDGTPEFVHGEKLTDEEYRAWIDENDGVIF